MRTIGLRASPKSIAFAIYDSEKMTFLNIEILKIPNALDTPSSLKYVRNTIIDILREYDIKQAGIRITEPNAKSTNIARIEIEGVIQEAFASSNLDKYYIGQISSISSRLKIPSKDFKRYIEDEIDYTAIENWSKLSKEFKEAALCAIGAVHA